ncbi:hypothetical protein KY342_02550 [Candidatus Woesearchaeota archaeon]|nr:hypothetical protein [Candidatus Woesearchaeota archaeon]
MKKYLLFAIIFMLSAVAVSAQDYDIKVTPITDSIYLEEAAEFEIKITNYLTTIQNFRVYSSEVEWNVPSITIKVYPESETTERLLITPTKYVGPGMYGMKLNIRKEESDELVEEVLIIHVKPPGQAVSEYLPSVRMTYEVADKIDPKDMISIKVILENQNILNLTDLVIKIRGDIAVFNTERNVQLKPLETKDVDFKYNLDPLQAPGKYKLYFELLKGDKIIDSTEPKVIEIGKISNGFKEEIKKETVFFKTVVEAIYSSSSNVKERQTIKIPVSWVKGLFTETIPESEELKEDGKRYLVIDIELEPGETKAVFIITNYRMVVYVVIFLVFIALLFYITKSPVKIRKGIAEVKTEEGGISSLKIMLQITSLSKRPIKHVDIVDNIPSIAELRKEFIPGTLKPTKMLKHPKKGTVLTWEVGELGPKEERIISYNIRSKLSILGSFRLPRAKIIIKAKGKEKHVYSNIVGIEV